MARNEWNFYADEVKEYPVFIISELKIIILIQRCVADGASISPQRRDATRRATCPTEREGGKWSFTHQWLFPASSPSSASSSFPRKYTEEHIKCGSSTHAH